MNLPTISEKFSDAGCSHGADVRFPNSSAAKPERERLASETFPGARQPPQRLCTLRRRASNFFDLGDGDDSQKIGLCFSGGGLRSAAFCAGFLQDFLREEIEFDYLSTVSGGGYVGSSYMDWKYREGGKDDPAWHKTYFERMPLNMCCSLFRFEQSFWLGMLDLAYRAVGLFWNVVIVTTALLIGLGCMMGTGVRVLIGARLQGHFQGRDPESAGSLLAHAALLMVMASVLKGAAGLVEKWRPTVGNHLLYTMLSILPLTQFVGVMAILIHETRLFCQLLDRVEEASDGKTLYYPLYIIKVVTSLFLPIAFWAVFAALTSVTGNDVRRFTVSSLVLYTLVFYLEDLLCHDTFLPSYEDGALRPTLLILLALLLPLIAVHHQNFFNLCYTTALAELFYHPKGALKHRLDQRLSDFSVQYSKQDSKEPPPDNHEDGSPKKTAFVPMDKTGEALMFGDVARLKPEFICQVTLGNWRYGDDDPRDLDDKMVVVSSKKIDVVDHLKEHKAKYLDLTPDLMELKTGMAMSAAGMSVFMGSIGSYLKEFFILFGIRTDAYIPSWFRRRNSAWELTKRLLTSVLMGVVMSHWLIIAIVRPQWVDSPVLRVTMMVSQFLFFFLSSMPVPSRGEDINVFTAISRVLLELSPNARFYRELHGTGTVGKYPDFVLHMSDGAFMENLGLLPMLQRRPDRIIIVDGSAHQSTDHANVLVEAMDYARKALGCQFTTLDNEDVDEDLVRKMGTLHDGSAPHSYRFKVIYMDEVDGEVESVGTGDIIIVQPRHPRQLIDGHWSGERGDDWTAEEADKLTGALTRSLHGACPPLFRSLHGPYPEYIGLWILSFMTPNMAEALMADGRRVMSAPAVQEFIQEMREIHEEDKFRAASRQNSINSSRQNSRNPSRQESLEKSGSQTGSMEKGASRLGSSSSAPRRLNLSDILDLPAESLDENF